LQKLNREKRAGNAQMILGEIERPENQNRPHKGKPRQQDTPERAAIPLYNIHVHKRIQQKDHQTLRLVVFLIAYVHRHDELLDIHIITRFVV